MGTKAAWSEERRRRQAEIIRMTKPWERSTGPRTDAGKRTSSQNAKSLRAARRRALKAVSENLLAQVRLYAEVLGIRDGELFRNRHRAIDFRIATEDQQDRYVDLIWDEMKLKSDYLGLWSPDILCGEHSMPDDLDLSGWNVELEYDWDYERNYGRRHSPDNDNDGLQVVCPSRFRGQPRLRVGIW